MLVPLDFPPGLYRLGTEFQSMGRYYDANLWRWFAGYSGPVGGWSALGSGVTGIARGAHSWVDLSAVGRLALATNAKMYVVTTSGTATEITPTGFSAVDASTAQWNIDNAGQQIFLVNDEDGTVYTWVPGDIEAAALSNAPSGAALLVTEERILMVLGAGGDPRSIKWSDVEGFTTWTPSATNFTRDFPLQSPGELMAGSIIRGGLLILTTEDAHVGRFLGRPNVYGFERVGEDCGIISRNALVYANEMGFWMGKDAFYRWAGGVDEIPCDVLYDVFGTPENPAQGINRTYECKVQAVHNAQFSEIWWFYPQGANTENSKAVVYNYAEDHWNLHTIARVSGVARGKGFQYPIMMGADGTVWRHEISTTRSGAGTIYAKSGPMQIGEGEATVYGSLTWPDEATAGDVDTYFHTRFAPNGTQTTYGPFSADNPAGSKFAGRQASVEHRLTDTDGGGRVGRFRVKVLEGGMM